MIRIRHALLAVTLICLTLAAAPSISAQDKIGPAAVIGVTDRQLDVAHWIDALPHPDDVILDRDQIAAQNGRVQHGHGMYDIAALPTSLDRATVDGWLRARSVRPSVPLYDAGGTVVDASTVDGWMRDIAMDAVPESQPTRYGLMVRRAPLRTFPTARRVFSTPGDTDIDRFQETALFPGTPVVIAQVSRDGQWWFVVANTYAAWVDKRLVAEGDRAQVLDYAQKTPYLVVTGATVRTTFTPDLPQVSGLQLDMGVRVPVLHDWPGAQAVNGQAAYASYVIELPMRDDQGHLRVVPALLPRTAGVAPDYLPLTRANVLRQAFKFLGERYGWGHDYDARDCSGFVSEVYRSFGVLLPRNTGDQARSDAFDRVALNDADGQDRRAEVLDALDVGDLVFVPGHVMLVIGKAGDAPYVIHDIQSTGWNTAGGAFVRVPLNGVSVTPLPPLRASVEQSYVDRITAIQRIRQ